jgi:hypothetical protein
VMCLGRWLIAADSCGGSCSMSLSSATYYLCTMAVIGCDAIDMSLARASE